MRVYKKDSIKVSFSEEDEKNIKDVASALFEELREQNIKLSIDAGALLYSMLSQCGVEELQLRDISILRSLKC